MTTSLVVATTEAVFDRSGQKCPTCGRRYAEVFYRPRAQNPSFRCVGIGHGGGCGHVWNLGEHHSSARRKMPNRPTEDEDTRASSDNTTGESIMSVAGTKLAKQSVANGSDVVAEGDVTPSGILPGERPSEAAMRLSEAERAAQPKPSMTKPAPKPSAKKPAAKSSKAKATSKGKAKATASKPAAKPATTAPATAAKDGPIYVRLSRRDSKFILIHDQTLFTDENMVTPTRFESKDAALAWAAKNGHSVVGK